MTEILSLHASPYSSDATVAYMSANSLLEAAGLTRIFAYGAAGPNRIRLATQVMRRRTKCSLLSVEWHPLPFHRRARTRLVFGVNC